MKLEDFYSYLAAYHDTKTQAAYASEIRQIERYLGKPPMVADLPKLATYGAWRLDEVSGATAAKSVTHYRCLWKLALEMGLIKVALPRRERIVVAQSEPVAYTDAELERLMTAATQIEGKYGNIPTKLWWQSIIRWMSWCGGERIGATLQIRWEHLQKLGEHWVFTLPASIRKGAKKPASYRIDKHLHDLLMSMPRAPLVWQWQPLAVSKLYEEFDRLLIAANIPANSSRKFHALRRTFATRAKLRGATIDQISRHMQHTSPEITNRYVDTRQCPDLDYGLLFGEQLQMSTDYEQKK